MELPTPSYRRKRGATVTTMHEALSCTADGKPWGQRVGRGLVDSMGRKTGRELDTDPTLMQLVRDVFRAAAAAFMASAPRCTMMPRSARRHGSTPDMREVAARWAQLHRSVRTELDARTELQHQHHCVAGAFVDAATPVGGSVLMGVVGDTTAAMLREAEAKQTEAAEETRLAEPQLVPPQEVLKGLNSLHQRERRDAYRRLLSEVRLTSHRAPGGKITDHWTAEIVPNIEAGITGLPKSVAFGKDCITVGRSASPLRTRTSTEQL